MNENQEILKNDITELLDLSNILSQSHTQSIIQEPEFYFQKGQDALKKWMEQSVSEELKNKLISLSKDYYKLQEEAIKRDDLKQVLNLLFEIIAYCDTHAKDKNQLNQYDDKRTLAFAFVRMNNWVEKLIHYKFLPDEVGEGSTKNAFDYLLHPINNSTMLSENHRQQLSENFIKKPYKSVEFVSDLESYFKDYNLTTTNPLNYSYLLTTIVYSFKDKWIDKKMVNITTQFADIIEQVKAVAEDDSEISNLFEFEKTAKNYVWIKDKSGIVGNLLAHYEIIKRKDNLFVEVHFEGKQHEKDIFRKDIGVLPDKLDWFKWNKSSSITLKEEFDINDTDVADKLVKGLLYMEESIGEQLRETMKSMNSDSTPKTKVNTHPMNQILYGPPGTGKTYNTINKSIAIANPKFDLQQPRTKIKEEFERLIKEGQIVFTTFHQSMSYEDFIEGIKPIEPEKEGGHVIYKIKDGIFKQISNKASQTKLRSIKIGAENQEITEEMFEDFYYQLVDTLVSADKEESNCILKTPEGYEFGLFKNSSGSITIKSGTKKAKMSASVNELIKVFFHGKLPTYKSYESKIISKILEDKALKESPADNTKKPFVLIIDEINRGNVSQIFGEIITLIEDDKRLGKEEALEVTLPYSKEKFSVPPNLYIIGTMNTADRSVEAIDTALRRRFSFEEMSPRYDLMELQYEFAGVKGCDILHTLNKRIEKLLDKDHQLGHSYFMKKNGNDVKEMLLNSFYKNIIPLLQEYFFGDFGKIGLVLGQGFVQKKEWNKNSDSFAEFDYESASEFEDRPVYEIVDHRDIDQADDSFVNAIKILMNKKIG